MNREEVYVVIAIETGSQVDGSGKPVEPEGCYCICDTRQTAEAVIDKDTRDGQIYPGAWISRHVIQTMELV